MKTTIPFKIIENKTMRNQSSAKSTLITLWFALIFVCSAVGQTIAMHASSERTGAQGNELNFAVQHTGNLPSSRVFFYVVNSAGVTENLGYTANPVGDLWWKSWIARTPGTYQVYAVLRTGFADDSTEIARAEAITVTITGSAIAMHTSSERTGAQGNKLNFAVQHTGNLPSSRVFFYVVNSAGVTENLGYTADPVGNLWWKSWIARSPGTYQVYAVLRTGFADDSTEIARAEAITVTITGSAIAMHTSSERTGAQGNKLNFAVQHTGNLPSSRVFFYVVNSAGVTENLGYTADPVGDLWWNSWIARTPGTYQVYAVLRTGFDNNSTEIARAEAITVTITGSAIAMHSSSARQFVSGKPSKAVAVTFGNVPSNARAFFYAVDTATEVTYELGSTGNPVGQLWSLEWTPKLSTTYYIYAKLRLGWSNDSREIARTGNFIIVPKGTPPFKALAGTYQALLTGPQRPLLTVRITAGGNITAVLVLDGASYRFKDRLEGDGTVVLRTPPGQQPSIALTLRTDSESKSVTGNYVIGTQDRVEFSLLPPAYSGKAKSVSPLARKTANIILWPETEAGREFLGYGYVRASFNRKGGARLTGFLPDGRKISANVSGLSSGESKKTVLPLSIAWKSGGPATLRGEFGVNESAGAGDALVEGDLEWKVSKNDERPILPQAYSANFTAIGNLWSTTKGNDSGAVDFTFRADPAQRVLASPATFAGSWDGSKFTLLSSLPAGSRWSYSRKTGIFSGRHTEDGGTYVFRGLLVPSSGLEVEGRELLGAGFMLGKKSSIEVEITTGE
jgi:20S proteasome alpha/beta subunit